MRFDEADLEFARLVEDNRTALKRYVQRRLSDPDGSDDVVVETLVVAWRKRGEIPPRDRELSWLFGIAFRVLSNHRRSRDRQNRLRWRLSREREATPEGEATSRVETDRLLVALATLGKIDRELLQLLYWENLKYRDVAAALGLTENAVAIRATRAKKTLRVLLADAVPTLDIGEGAEEEEDEVGA